MNATVPLSDRHYLIIGGDGLLGRALVGRLRGAGRPVTATSRRPLFPGSLGLDLRRLIDFAVPSNITYAFVAASISGQVCENNPEAAFVNTQALPALMARLLDQGIFVHFISSQAIFDGEMPAPTEDCPPCPASEYGRHKLVGEDFLRGGNQGPDTGWAVTRLTKCLDAFRPPVSQWLDAWRAGRAARPFSDLSIAPVSRQYVAESLTGLAEKSLSGLFHLSGVEVISYAELARRLALALKVPTRLVEPILSSEAGRPVGRFPRHPDLGLDRSSRLALLSPQPLAAMTADLTEDCRRYFSCLSQPL